MTWHVHGGEMACRIRTHDWSASCLGTLGAWPRSLRAAVDVLLQMAAPAILCWGPDEIVLPNDACVALGNGGRDYAVGGTLATCWPDSVAFRAGMRRARAGGASFGRDEQLDIRQDGRGKTAWFNLSYSPLHDDDNHPMGALAVFFDTTDRVLAEASLRESERQLASIFAQAHVGLSLISLEGNFLRVNDELCRMLDRPRELLLRLGIRDVTHPDDLDTTLRAVGELIANGNSVSVDKRYVRPDGGVVFANSIISRLESGAGARYTILAVTVDLTERKLAQDALAESEAKFRALADASSALIWQLDPDGLAIYINPRHEVLLGVAPEQLLGFGWLDALHPDDRDEVMRDIRRAIAEELTTQYRVRVRFADGAWHWMEAHSAPWFAADGKYAGHVGIAFDIDTAVRVQQDLLISNERLKLAIEGSGDGIWDWDLEHNDIVYSPRARDILCLQEEEPVNPLNAIDRIVHPDDLAALKLELHACMTGLRPALRIEYRVRQPDGGWRWVQARATVVAQKINETLSKPFCLGNEVVYLSASIGITLYPSDAPDAENLIRNADQAMYAVKSQGRNHFSYFTPSMQREANERLHLISELRNALARKQLQVHYQPIIDLHNGAVVKAEALLRWQHPRLGMIEPVRFIAFAEEAGLISEIGDWVFRQAAGCARRWGERVGQPFPVSINKSPVQFVSRLNEVNWPAYLKELGLTGSSVSVEITEGLLLDASPFVTDKLLQYHNAGIKVAIDDFGTGYSSIAYLKKFEVDYLKIDQSFVRDIAFDIGDRAIVRSIIAMAHELGLQVIAEGIETSEQREFLVDGQCDFGQGFLFSKAVPAEEFDRLLAAAV